MKVRFINGEVGEFMAWVTVDRQIYAMVLRQGKFQAWEFSSIETAPEPADYSKPEPDYKQANFNLVNLINKRYEDAKISRDCDFGKTRAYWAGNADALRNILMWIDEHNPKGGE